MPENKLNSKIEKLKKEIAELKTQSAIKSKADNLEDFDKSVLIHELQVHQIELEMQNQMLQESQQQLTISNQHYQDLFNKSPGGLAIVDKSGMIKKVNSTLIEMLNLSKQNIINTAFASLIFPADRTIFNSLFRTFYKIPDSKEINLRLARQHGGFIYVKITGSKINPGTQDGKESLQLSITDITVQKEIEIKLKEEKQFSDLLINTVSSGIFTVDEDLAVTSWNKSAERITGYSADEVIGNKCVFFNQCDNVCFYNGEKTSVPQLNKECRLITKDGRTILVSKNSERLKDIDGETIGAFESFEDITERRKDEERIKKLLSEKEIILREVHHRIKNNMATIESLLNLQAVKIADRNTEAALLDAAGRVSSMRILYEKLFDSDNFGKTDIKEYMSSLIDEIISVFPGRQIEIVKDIDSFSIDARVVFPVGIIINELITNIMKYAFSEQDSGRVLIKAKNKAGRAEISVEDNGKGLPEGFSIENSNSFGLQLVQMLTQQLNGNITIDGREGTKISLQFKLEQ